MAALCWPGLSTAVCGQAVPTHQHQSPSALPIPADAASSPSQYYEMSYGLNIEMHKQVSPGGTGALSQLPVPAPCPCHAS